MSKISIRFFNDKEVRAVWDDTKNTWCFSVVDIVGAIRNEDSYEKCRNYWKYLKAKLKKQNSQVVSATTQLKLATPDGKRRLSDVLDTNGVVQLASEFPSKIATSFIKWFIYSDDTIDGKSKTKAYAMFESSFIDSIEVGTIKGLQQIHSYLFGGLYDFAGTIRTKNISKGGFQFAQAQYLEKTLSDIDAMSESTLEQIVDKYVEMNVAHPFMEGNGRTTRIWLDLLLKKNLKLCVDWSSIKKYDYLNAMKNSVSNSAEIYDLIKNALTDKIADRAMFMKGIDYSFYYEEEMDIDNY